MFIRDKHGDVRIIKFGGNLFVPVRNLGEKFLIYGELSNGIDTNILVVLFNSEKKGDFVPLLKAEYERLSKTPKPDENLLVWLKESIDIATSEGFIQRSNKALLKAAEQLLEQLDKVVPGAEYVPLTKENTLFTIWIRDFDGLEIESNEEANYLS
ncbi:MAG: hypothetical protein MJ210_00615 [Alphaproteobacteria bacterium]|nr:hypothetical protein [Alphaproteobacteria bacterium]